MNPMGFVVVDTEGVSTVPGLAAIGDISIPRGSKVPFGQVAQALGNGSRIAAIFNYEIILEDQMALE